MEQDKKLFKSYLRLAIVRLFYSIILLFLANGFWSQNDTILDSTNHEKKLEFGIEAGANFGLINGSQKDELNWSSYWPAYTELGGLNDWEALTEQGTDLAFSIRYKLTDKLYLHSRMGVVLLNSKLRLDFDSITAFVQPRKNAFCIAFTPAYHIESLNLDLKLGGFYEHYFKNPHNNEYLDVLRPHGGIVFAGKTMGVEAGIQYSFAIGSYIAGIELRYKHGLIDAIDRLSSNAMDYGFYKMNYNQFSVLLQLRN